MLNSASADAGLAWVSTAYTLTFGGLPAARSAGGRHLRATPDVPRRANDLFACLASDRRFADTGCHDCRKSRAGSRFCHPRPFNAGSSPDQFRAGSRADARSFLLCCCSRRIRGIRPGDSADFLPTGCPGASGFFINLPIGLAMMVAAKRYVRETERIPGTFDIAGAIISTLGIVALVYGVIRSASTRWSDVMTEACVGLGIVMLILFAFVESRASQPIMPLSLFRRPGAGRRICSPRPVPRGECRILLLRRPIPSKRRGPELFGGGLRISPDDGGELHRRHVGTTSDRAIRGPAVSLSPALSRV